MLTTKNNRLIALLVCFALLLTVIVPLATITAHADEPTITPGLYYIKNQKYGLYMDLTDGSTTNNTLLTQKAYTGNYTQAFVVEYASGNSLYYIRPYSAQNMRLEVENCSSQDNANIVLKPNTNQIAAMLEIASTGSGSGNGYKILTCASSYNRAITPSTMGSQNTTLVQRLYAYNGEQDEDHWIFEPITAADIKVAKLRIFSYPVNGSSIVTEDNINDAALLSHNNDLELNPTPLEPDSSINNTGHAFLTVENISPANITVGHMTGIAPFTQISIGTFYFSDDTAATGINYNYEKTFLTGSYFAGSASLTTYLTASQLNTLTARITAPIEDHWFAVNNCTRFSTDMWNSVSNIQIAEGFLFPSVLRDHILSLDGAISEEVIGPLPNNKYYVSNGVLIQY